MLGRSSNTPIWSRIALALLVLGGASLAVAVATYDRIPSDAETPLVRPGAPDSVTAYAEVDEGIDHDAFLGSGVAFVLSAALVGAFAVRRQRQDRPIRPERRDTPHMR